MKAILLAAGLGTRLRPLTNTIPKCLVSICGRALLATWLDRLFDSGTIERVLINTHYLPDQVVDYVRGCKWANNIDLVYEPELLGTAGTLRKNREWIGETPTLVAHADNLTFFDVPNFLSAHKRRPLNCVLSMMTFDTDTPQTCGIVEEENGIVIRFHEKVTNPPGNRANAAVYIIEKEVLKFIESLGSGSLDFSTQILPNYLGRIATYHNNIYHRDIGNIESLALAERELVAMNLC